MHEAGQFLETVTRRAFRAAGMSLIGASVKDADTLGERPPFGRIVGEAVSLTAGSALARRPGCLALAARKGQRREGTGEIQ